jgi:hypothetical protein
MVKTTINTHSTPVKASTNWNAKPHTPGSNTKPSLLTLVKTASTATAEKKKKVATMTNVESNGTTVFSIITNAYGMVPYLSGRDPDYNISLDGKYYITYFKIINILISI